VSHLDHSGTEGYRCLKFKSLVYCISKFDYSRQGVAGLAVCILTEDLLLYSKGHLDRLELKSSPERC
jgi:hypothetical protein